MLSSSSLPSNPDSLCLCLSHTLTSQGQRIVISGISLFNLNELVFQLENSSEAGTSKMHQKIKPHDARLQYLSDTAKQFLRYGPTTPATGAAHLARSHFDGLLLDDPGDRLG